MSQYAYLIAGIISLIIWSFFYKINDKETRKEMIVLGIIAIIIGVSFQLLFWTKDWWLPPTITGTIVGFEDVLYAFTTGGILATISQVIFKKRIAIEKTSKNNMKAFLSIGILSVVIISVLFYVFSFHSFHATIISCVLPSLIVFIFRKDLIPVSLLNAVIWFFLSPVLYTIINIFQPGFVYDIWLLESISGIVILSTPLEDAIWYATAAMFTTILYKVGFRGKVSYNFSKANK